MASGIKDNADIKNPNEQLVRVDTEAQKSVFIGGGKSDAAGIVGQEFADITGGTWINWEKGNGDPLPELDDLLAALLTSSRNEAPGLEGVRLVSISSDTFTIGVRGNEHSTNFVEFSGSVAADAIDGVLFRLGNGNEAVNLKNSASQVTVFDTDQTNSIFVGSSNAASEEAKDLIGGSSLKMDEAEDLLVAAVTGKQANGSAGIEGVDLVGLTDQGFALRIDGQAATTDTIIFEGQGALNAIAAADAAQGADFKDGKTALDVFDVETEGSEFVGGTEPATIGADFDALIGGSSIHRDQVLDIFEALISGSARKGDAGLDEVELIGLNDTSFSIAVNTSGGNTDYILFTNVDTLDGAGTFGFGDGPGFDDIA